MKCARWCPNGCGKCVTASFEYINYNTYIKKHTSENVFFSKYKRPYLCTRCKNVFTRDKLEGLNNFKK